MERIFRKARVQDLDELNEILGEAIRFLRQQNIDQWQKGYPNKKQLQEDIKQGYLYVAQEEDGLKGMCVVNFEKEKSYERIEGGAWSTDDKNYAVVHRFATHPSAKGKGVAGYLFEEIEKLSRKHEVSGIRIDTHADNLRMQHVLENAGYQKCGVIHLVGGVEHGVPRLAYEKLLKSEEKQGDL